MITSDDVHRARYDARMTQMEAASLLGVSKRAWESWESGARNCPACKLILFKMLVAQRRAESVMTGHRTPAQGQGEL